MKHLLLSILLLCFCSLTYSQYNDNPVCGCKLTKNYGTVSETFYLTCTVHIAKPGEFVDFRVYEVKDGGYANMTIKFVDFKPRFCGEWRLTDKDGYAIEFVDSPEEATFTVKFGEPAEVYGFFDEPR